MILSLFGCSSETKNEDNKTTTPIVKKNTAPSIPLLKSPINNKLCIDNQVFFEWNESKDDENDAIIYNLEISKGANILYYETPNLNKTIQLEKNSTYFWKVRATDSKGAIGNYSDTYKIYTSPDVVGNHLPFVPELILPSQKNFVSSYPIKLEWKASDPDVSDVLSYDVYLDAVNPPMYKLYSDTKDTYKTNFSYSRGMYYWRVVVKDNKGGITEGPVWIIQAYNY